MTQHTAVVRRLWASGLLLAVLAGCETDGWGRRDELPPEPPPKPRSIREYTPLVAGTIGEQTLLADVGVEPLRGFGVVVGLNGKGSSDCPTAVREYLIDFMSKQPTLRGDASQQPRQSPGELIDSLDTAVVEVQGVVPPGSLPGARFDLRVQTVPGTSTESLAGGLLLPTQLRHFDASASGSGLFAGPVLAEGGGPVFVNPFVEESESTPSADPCQGSVLGGGRAAEGRTVRLLLLRPSYATARAIERRINERFGHKPKIANALSRAFVELQTPPEFAGQPEHFRRLVAHLYLDRRPEVQEQSLRELCRLAVTEDAPLDALALAWEGMGSSATPHLQPLYTHANVSVRYYAAQAGLRVGDLSALPVLGEVAVSGPHSLRLLAIRELAISDSPQAAVRLAPLLDDADREIRIAAYEALLQHHHPAIRSIRFPFILDGSQLNFSLDVVETTGPPLLYVRRTRWPRIAVFGPRLALLPPVFYTHPEDSLTVHTVDGSDDVHMFMKRGRLSDDIVVPPRVVDVIRALADLPVRGDAGTLRGIGLPYSRVVQVLATLAGNETVTAPLVLEQTSMTDLLGPDTGTERDEADQELSVWPEDEPQPEKQPPPEQTTEERPE